MEFLVVLSLIRSQISVFLTLFQWFLEFQYIIRFAWLCRSCLFQKIPRFSPFSGCFWQTWHCAKLFRFSWFDKSPATKRCPRRGELQHVRLRLSGASRKQRSVEKDISIMKCERNGERLKKRGGLKGHNNTLRFCFVGVESNEWISGMLSQSQDRGLRQMLGIALEDYSHDLRPS